MKTTIIASVSALLISLSAYAQEAPAIPVGSLSTNLSIYRPNVKPYLTWDIEYPEDVTDVVVIPPDEEVETKTRLRVQVSVIGVGLTDSSGRQYDAQSYMHFSSSGWQQIFYGKGRDVNPSQIIIDKVVEQGETIRFAARYPGGSLGYQYNESNNVVVLKNGDTPPGKDAGYNSQSSVAEFLRPYVQDGKLALGPLDLIYCAEVTHTNPNHYGFDLQDTIVLVRFTKVP
ncbi:MAG: hypothetical protein ACPG32_05860 [Akkermansiaceae bacterium]